MRNQQPVNLRNVDDTGLTASLAIKDAWRVRKINNNSNKGSKNTLLHLLINQISVVAAIVEYAESGVS